MSYTISVTGHKDYADPEEAASFEEGIAERAAEFVKSLEGVTSANGTFGQTGVRNFLAEQAGATAEPETGDATTPATEPAVE